MKILEDTSSHSECSLSSEEDQKSSPAINFQPSIKDEGRKKENKDLGPLAILNENSAEKLKDTNRTTKVKEVRSIISSFTQIKRNQRSNQRAGQAVT